MGMTRKKAAGLVRLAETAAVNASLALACLSALLGCPWWATAAVPVGGIGIAAAMEAKKEAIADFILFLFEE